MANPRPLSILVAAALVVGGTYLVRELTRSDPAAPVAAGSLSAGTVAAADTAELDRLIDEFTVRSSETSDQLNYAYLGQLHYARARLTGDPGDYVQAETALAQARELAPTNLDTATTLAAARLALHGFASARDLAGEIYAADPTRLEALAVAGDAHLALGAYDEAAAAYDTIAAALPANPAAMARRAQLDYLLGDGEAALDGAGAAVQLAQAQGLAGPDLSFYFAFHGDLAFELGDLERSYQLFSRAVDAYPASPAALAGLARATAAGDDLETAIELYQAVVDQAPDPGTLADLGDLYLLTGEAERAEELYRSAVELATADDLSRRLYARDLAFIYADRDRKVEEAVTLAEAELAMRTDVAGWDAYAWALYRAGRWDEARWASDRALALATPDAHFYFHAGLISAALGDDARAHEELTTAFAINPHFGPFLTREAARVLDGLPGG